MKTGEETKQLSSGTDGEIKMEDDGSRTRGFTQFNCLVFFFCDNDIKLWRDLTGGVYLIAILIQSGFTEQSLKKSLTNKMTFKLKGSIPVLLELINSLKKAGFFFASTRWD